MGIRVLVLEPDTELGTSFLSYFGRLPDFDTQLAATGTDCIEQLHRFDPDVLVMEPALPPGMADSVLSALSGIGNRPFTPVLILTRFSDHAAAEHPRVKAFLVKPQSLKTIADAIRSLAQTSARE